MLVTLKSTYSVLQDFANEYVMVHSNSMVHATRHSLHTTMYMHSGNKRRSKLHKYIVVRYTVYITYICPVHELNEFYVVSQVH